MNFAIRIQQLMHEHGDDTAYKLHMYSDIPQSTISSIMNGTIPTFSTLEAFCDYFGISLAQFFADPEKDNFYPLTDRQRELIEKWCALTTEQQDLVLNLIDQMK